MIGDLLLDPDFWSGRSVNPNLHRNFATSVTGSLDFYLIRETTKTFLKKQIK